MAQIPQEVKPLLSLVPQKSKDSKIRKQMAEEFLEVLDPYADAFLFAAYHPENDTTITEEKPYGLFPGKHIYKTLAGAWDELQALNDRDYGIFVTVNKTKGGQRSKEAIVEVRAVFKEEDEPGGKPFPFEPSMVVESSPGKYHKYFLIHPPEIVTKQTRLEYRAIMDCMAAVHGSDKAVKDISRVLRLPGFFNTKKKYKGRPLVAMIAQEGQHEFYEWKDIRKAFPAPRIEATDTDDGEIKAFDEFTWEDRVERILKAKDYYLPLLGAAQHLANQGTPRKASIAILQGLMNLSYQWKKDKTQEYISDWEAKYSSIENYVDTGIEKAEREIEDEDLPSWEDLAATLEEMKAARTNPTEIVKGLYFADIALLSAPGGVGKTTFMLWQLIHIALGLPLFGREILTPGRSIFVTAEDSREVLLGRMYRLCLAMDLPERDILKVAKSVVIYDISGKGKKLVRVKEGMIHPSAFVDHLIAKYGDDPPKMLFFDPVVSFGAGESKVNDNEQGIIDGCKRIVRAWENTCVGLVAHTGQASARTKDVDQYSNRGGSALPDGSRMVASIKNEGKISEVFKFQLHKGSYTSPPYTYVKITRTGWKFEWEPINEEMEKAVELTRKENAIIDHIRNEAKEGRFYSTRYFPVGDIGKNTVAEILTGLIFSGGIVEEPLPKDEARGAKKYRLKISSIPSHPIEKY